MDIYRIRQIMKERHLSIFDLKMNVTFYGRVSSKTDEQLNSMHNQVGHFTDLIQKNPNWAFVEGYVDEIRGESAENRENFLRMIEDAKKGKFDYILAKETSRFGRDIVDCVSYVRELMHYGVCIYFESDGINTIDQDAELKLGLMATIAQDEVRKLSERIKFGHRRAIENNHILGNSRIFGYNYNKNGLTINEDEATMVRKLFEIYATDEYSLKELERVFWDMGYRNRNGNMISHNTFSGIIKNPKYKGYYCGGKVKIEDYRTKKQRFLPEEEWRMFKDESGELVPQIIDEDTWERANIILARRSNIIKQKCTSIKRSSPFTGMIYCTHDGKPFWRTSNTTKKTGIEYIWVCCEKRRKGAKSCPSIALYERELYEILNKVLLPQLKDIPQAIDEYIEFFCRSVQKRNHEAEIRRLHDQVDKINLKKDRLLELNLDATITKDEFSKRNNRLNAELADIEDRIAALRSEDLGKSGLIRELHEIKTYLSSHLQISQTQISEEVIKKLIYRIEVTPVNECKMEINIVLKTKQETRALYQHNTMRSRNMIRQRAESPMYSGAKQSVRHSGNMSKKMIEAYENSMK